MRGVGHFLAIFIQLVATSQKRCKIETTVTIIIINMIRRTAAKKTTQKSKEKHT